MQWDVSCSHTCSYLLSIPGNISLSLSYSYSLTNRQHCILLRLLVPVSSYITLFRGYDDIPSTLERTQLVYVELLIASYTDKSSLYSHPSIIITSLILHHATATGFGYFIYSLKYIMYK